MGTPKYPKKLGDTLRGLQQGVTEAQAAAQNREPFAQASQGLNLPDLPGHPAAPVSGVTLYAFAGHLWCKDSDGGQTQLTF